MSAENYVPDERLIIGQKENGDLVSVLAENPVSANEVLYIPPYMQICGKQNLTGDIVPVIISDDRRILP